MQAFAPRYSAKAEARVSGGNLRIARPRAAHASPLPQPPSDYKKEAKNGLPGRGGGRYFLTFQEYLPRA